MRSQGSLLKKHLPLQVAHMRPVLTERLQLLSGDELKAVRFILPSGDLILFIHFFH